MPEYKYSIDEENKDPMDSIILKEGLQAKFTLRELELDKKNADKIMEELEAQIKLDSAQQENLVNNNPNLFKEKDGKTVLKASEEKIKEALVITMWSGLQTKLKESTDRQKEFNEVFKGFMDEVKDIKDQTGLELKITSPYGKNK